MKPLTLLAGSHTGLDAPECNPAVNMTTKESHPAPIKKVKRESDRKHDTPSDDHKAEEDDGVIGEVEQPAPPSEKPEAL